MKRKTGLKSSPPSWSRSLPAFVLGCSLTGCTQITPFHENTSTDPRVSVRMTGDHQLAFVEFGEQGSYQDTSQLDAALDLIRRARRPLVVTYVHGWQNDAGSDDVRRFSGMLQQLGESAVIRREAFQVIGVYLGWRGRLTKVPVVKELTFYSRKAAAERLASNFDCFDAIAAISEAARDGRAKGDQYTILLGHSFGGLVVERSVAHAINAEMHGHADKDRSLPADLILLLNPASDSILARQMIGALYSRRAADSRQIVVSLTSSGNAATGTYFPIGTGAAAVGKVFNEVRVPSPDSGAHMCSERSFYTSTPGHNRFLLNHKTILCRETVSNPSGASAFDFNLEHNHVGRGFVTDGEKPGTFRVWRFSEQGGPFGLIRVPYWDVEVDPAIIKDHGDIWNANSRAMMAAIFRMNFPRRLAAAGAKPFSLLGAEAPGTKTATEPPERASLHRAPDRSRMGYRQGR